MLDEVLAIFEVANTAFIERETKSILQGVSERCLCGSFKSHIERALETTRFRDYHVDVEYNRNNGKIKTIVNGRAEPIAINCDVIVHSRGESVEQDNLLAIEMKRSSHSQREKEKDMRRLTCLTRDTFNETWSYDGTTLPEHVCRYVLGIYYELDTDGRTIAMRYYAKGEQFREESRSF